MPKINQEEYEKIKLLPDYDWNWIAREKTGKILSFTNKPAKTDEVWKDKQTRLWFNYKDSQLFQFIQWEDEEPYNIAELIGEYEYSTEHVSHVVNERVKALGKAWSESEETEVKKDVEWLKNEVNELPLRFLGFSVLKQREEFTVNKDDVLELINQLDEPEVLSQELPAVPKFVAEWYESEGKRSSWWNWFYKWGRDESRTELESKAIRWMQDFNEEAFVNMFLHGYTVEEEQKYQVVIRDGKYMWLYLCKHDGNVTIGTNDNYIEKCPEVTYLTEQEIKDYDERFWPFAVKVEELEK